MIAKASNVLRFGFTYDTPTWYTISEETSQYLETSIIDEEDNISLLVTNPNAINIYEDYTLKLPSKITASTALVFKISVYSVLIILEEITVLLNLNLKMIYTFLI